MADDKLWLILGGVAVLFLFRSSSSASPTVTPSGGRSPGTSPTGVGSTTPAISTPGGVLISPIAIPATPPPVTVPPNPALPTAPQLAITPIAIGLIAAGGLAQQASNLPAIQGITEGSISAVKTVAPYIFTNPPAPVLGPGYPSDPGGLTDFIAGDPNSGAAVSAIQGGSVDVQPTSLGLSDMVNLSTVLQTLGVVALVVDIGFTIAGDAPNAVKAIDTALDAAAIAAIYIPVYGWIVAIVVEVVKFIFGLFAGSLFGGLSHAQRQALETARYASYLHNMFPQIATSYSPRELLSVLIAWTSGSCGGVTTSAIVTGLHNTPSPGVDLYFGAQGCAYNAGGPNAGITLDEQAMWLAQKGQTTDFFAIAQSGIAANLIQTFNAEVQNVVTARCVVFAEMAAQGLTLDQMDTVASEYRRADSLNRLARIYGFPSWQELFAAILQPAWAPYVAAHPSGSLNDFAQTLGYADAVALRDAAFAGFLPTANRVMALEDRIATLESEWLGGAQTQPDPTPGLSADASVAAYVHGLQTREAAVVAAIPSRYLMLVGYPVAA